MQKFDKGYLLINGGPQGTDLFEADGMGGTVDPVFLIYG